MESLRPGNKCTGIISASLTSEKSPQNPEAEWQRHFCHHAGRKSCAITTARRLGHFLGDERIKDKGLNCNYVVARRPEGTPTSERAVPVAIFATEPAIARAFLRKWCGDVCEGAALLPFPPLPPPPPPPPRPTYITACALHL